LPEVESELSQAESTTREAEEAMGDAQNNARLSLTGAEEAKLKASNLEKEAAQLTATTESTRANLTGKKEQVDQIVGTIDGLGTTSKDFENQAQSDSEKSSEVLKKASLAESNAKVLQVCSNAIQ